MRLTGINPSGLVFCPKFEKELEPCDHKYGAIATWSHCTDTSQPTYAIGEISAFKHNLAMTMFISRYFGKVDVQDMYNTGRTRFGIYFNTGSWVNPNTKETEIIPDYMATTWSQSAVDVGFITADLIGTKKPYRYPNHGQEMYDLTNGLYGYDIVNDIAGQIDVTTPLIDIEREWFYGLFGKYPNSASYQNGQKGVYYNLMKYFLGARDSDIESTSVYNLTHTEAMTTHLTTRQGDENLTREESHQLSATKLQEVITNGGWYKDFTHWHTTPDSELEDYFASQRIAIGDTDVVTLDFGTAYEYMYLRNMVRRVGLITSGQELVLITETKDYENLPLELIETDLSVEVDLAGTILENKEIVAENSKGIKKKGNNVFVVEIPYDKKDGFKVVRLKETLEPQYLDFSLPILTSAVKSGNTLTIITDKPTNVVIYSVPSSGQLYQATVMKRSSITSDKHEINVEGLDFSAVDIYFGIITETKQSILSEKYTF